MMNVKDIVARYQHVEGQRDNWNNHYQELADYMLPRKADIVKKRSRGEKRMELIFDGTALQAVDLLSSSLHGMLTSGATPWFHLTMTWLVIKMERRNSQPILMIMPTYWMR